MSFRSRLYHLIPDLATVLGRFPVPAAVSIVFCCYFNYLEYVNQADWQDDLMLAAGAAFIASGAAHLFAEGRHWPPLTSATLALGAGMALAAVTYFAKFFETSSLLLFAGLVSMLKIAAYLRPQIAQGAIWLFNLRLGLAVLLAGLVAVVFGGGLSAIVETLNFLFGADLPGDLHRYIWTTALSLVAPLYGLSLMPQDLDEAVELPEAKSGILERGVSVLVNYVLVPLVVVYALILHAYAAKIVLQQELPKGQIGTMVCIFALGGTASWLICWPWRETGTQLLRLFMRGWFWLTIVPAVLLSIAVGRRIQDYGVTPDRYGLALVAVWLALLAFYLAIRRNRADMRAILGGLALLLFAGAFGPWGANGVTIGSQFARLESFLAAQGVLKDGKVAEPLPAITSEQRSEGYSMLAALGNVHGLDRLRPWFAGSANDPFLQTNDALLAGDIGGRLGWNPVYTTEYLGFSANRPLVQQISGARRIVGPFRIVRIYDQSKAGPQEDLTANYDRQSIEIRVGDRYFSVPTLVLLTKLKSGLAPSGQPQPAIAVEVAPGVTLIADQMFADTGSPPEPRQEVSGSS